MQFISMDLIGELHPPTKKGHRFALTVIWYAYRLCILCTLSDQDCSGGYSSLY